MSRLLIIFSIFLIATGCESALPLDNAAATESNELNVDHDDNADSTPSETAMPVAETPTPEATTASGDEKDYLEIGFELMATENIGGLYYSMPEDEVIELLGEPAIQEEPELWGADGLYHWTYIYPEIDVSINFASEDTDSGKVSYFSIVSQIGVLYGVDEPDTWGASTLRGIHIGSTRQDVIDAYADEINTDDFHMNAYSDGNIIVAGTSFGGIIFGFSETDEVISIFVGAAAE